MSPFGVCLRVQGPAGKDGLPGHPGQRGEPVSEFIRAHAAFHSIGNFFATQTHAHKCLVPIFSGSTGIPREDGTSWAYRGRRSTGEQNNVNLLGCVIFLYTCASLITFCSGKIRRTWPTGGPGSPRGTGCTWRAWFTWGCWEGRGQGESTQ